MAILKAAVRRAHLGLIRTASFAVPASKRAEWLQEWQAELWYALQESFSEGIPDPFGEPQHSVSERFAMRSFSRGDPGKESRLAREPSRESVVRPP